MENKKEELKKVDKETSISIIEILSIFFKNRMKIFLITGIICIISIILYFFVFDLIYTSTASIKSSNISGNIMGGLDIGIGDIGGGLDELGLGSSKSAKELATYEEILNSRKCIEPLILKFGLMERDKYRFLEDAYKSFRDNNLKITTEKMAGIMFVSVEDKDPILAKDMTEFLINELDKINIELNVQNAKNNREFIEQRYYLAKEDLRKAEDSLKSFQFIYGVAPDLQIKASAQSVYTMESELKAEEIKLEVLKGILNSDQPEVKMQESKINALRAKIGEIETSTDLNEILRLGNSPQIGMEYLRLTREIEIQTKIQTFLLPLYEKAKIDEKRETPTIIILDKPVVAERKSKPKRLTMVVVLTFIGFGITYSYYIAKYKWKNFRNSYAYKSIKSE